MCKDEITFEKLPEAVGFLIHEVTQLRSLIEEIQRPDIPKRPIEINEACKILMKAKSTVYTLVRKGDIPCYKSGKKLYFYEDELLEWINTGRKNSSADTHSHIPAIMTPEILSEDYSIPFSKKR
uniref:helix-turn-helix domain-containing protein n=1 Tax=uncultured Draconibacterium sp. TaxID=1573823 RepID=UPI003216B183